MSDQSTPETENDTQFELAAWELLKEARERIVTLEFHLKTTRTENKEHEDDYLAIWKMVKQPDETVVEAVRRTLRELDQARDLARELRDALENCREDSVELLGEWAWKRGTIPRNDRSIEELEGRVSIADSVIAKAKEVLP